MPNRGHSGERGVAPEPGTYEHGPWGMAYQSEFMVSGPAPLGHPGMTTFSALAR
jgi:hypothetical protein